MTNNSAEQNILNATITCIEKYGIENTTTRKIASEAGTNIASINYYYRSKDDLIAKAMDTTLQHMVDDLLEILNQSGKPFEEVLRESILWFLDGSQKFPRLIVSHMYAPLIERQANSPVVVAFSKVKDLMMSKASNAYPQANDKDIRLALVDSLSLMLFSVILPGFFEENKSLSDNELADRYVTIFKRLTGIYEEQPNQQ